jgi:hypothetical protein
MKLKVSNSKGILSVETLSHFSCGECKNGGALEMHQKEKRGFALGVEKS